jgi:hypothetical protein
MITITAAIRRTSCATNSVLVIFSGVSSRAAVMKMSGSHNSGLSEPKDLVGDLFDVHCISYRVERDFHKNKFFQYRQWFWVIGWSWVY